MAGFHWPSLCSRRFLAMSSGSLRAWLLITLASPNKQTETNSLGKGVSNAAQVIFARIARQEHLFCSKALQKPTFANK